MDVSILKKDASDYTVVPNLKIYAQRTKFKEDVCLTYTDLQKRKVEVELKINNT